MKIKHCWLAGAVAAGILCLAGCGNNITVSIQDGNQTYIYQGEKCCVSDILDKFGLEIGESDTMSAGLGDFVSGNSNIVINRQVTVTVEHDGRTTEITTVGGKIADAIEAAGVTLNEGDSVNFSEDDYLYDGMKIVVNTKADTKEGNTKSVKNSNSSSKKTATEQATTDTVENTTTAGSWDESWDEDWDDWDDWDDYWYDDWYDDIDYSDGYDANYYAVDINDDSGDSPAVEIDDPEEDEGGGDVYVVSSVCYDDCDGSGHGVMVTTYSDGSQTEEYY